IHTEPEILLVDEVLAVGDIGFQRRCTQRIRELRAAGVTIVVASHSVEEVRSLCDDVMWLRGGRVIATGSPDEVLDRYSEVTSEETRLLTPLSTDGSLPSGGVKLDLHENRFGTQEATIDGFRILDCWGQEKASVPTSTSVRIEITVSAPVDFEQVNLSVKLARRRDGLVCLDTSTQMTPTMGSTEVIAEIGRLDLAPGDYAFDVGLYTVDWDRTLDFHKAAYRLQVTGPGPADAVMAPPVDWTVADRSTSEGLGPVVR
ncbi:MAG TPA: Wzt carbohydrate-binding domain-containing protein, partial [Acidimicrobiales bacterium]|nr:Wzt carbohydrate-binding domain-containing protein [Acidimicrobiales bacterium]